MTLEIGPQRCVTLAPLVAVHDGSIRRAVESLRGGEIRAVQLSAAQRGIRPRELDHRAWRDVLAMLARNGLTLSGLDLMIPHRDWTDAAAQAKAVDAVLAAIELAADFGRVPLSLSLPVTDLPEDIRRAMMTAADGRNVTLAVHAEDELDALATWLANEDQPTLAAAIDPAALLAGGEDPADAVLKLADHLRVARLEDFARTSVATAGGRCPLGAGELDLTTYRATLSTATKLSSLVIELRDQRDPVAALAAAIDAW